MDATPLGIKQAALVLHGLAPADRDWMLSQLPGDQHHALRLALVELHTLGIPRDAALTQTAAAASRAEPGGDPDIEALSRASAEAVARALHGQPTPVVRAVLQMHDWPWGDEVRAQFGIPAGMDEPTARLGPAFRACLAASVAKRLPRDIAQAPPASTVRTRRLAGWLRAITRRPAP
jgi:hypothetical protein